MEIICSTLRILDNLFILRSNVPENDDSFNPVPFKKCSRLSKADDQLILQNKRIISNLISFLFYSICHSEKYDELLEFLGDYVAVKVFDFNRSLNNINSIQRLNSFQTEIQMADRMRNEVKHVVTMYGYDFDRRNRLGFIVMELADETFLDRVANLHQMHRQSNMMDSDYVSSVDRKNIWIHLVNIILALHRNGVVHRDIKPANLLFFGPVLKVVDLGIAQDESASYHGRRRLGGTHPYSAPECFSGRAPITSKADIWSAGAILYYMTYGKTPVYETPQPPYGISQTRSALVRDVLKHCFQRDPYLRADHQWLTQHPLTKRRRGF